MAHRRTQDELKRDRAKTAALYLRGRSQYEIAELLNEETNEDGALVRDYTLSQQQISNDLQRIREEWQKSALVDFHQMRAEELARIDHLEETYWQQYEDSMQERSERKVSGNVQDNAPGGDGAPGRRMQPTEFENKTKDPVVGDPKFLRGVQWCIEKRCELLGLDAPEFTMSVDVDWSDLSDDELEDVASGKDVRTVLHERTNGTA